MWSDRGRDVVCKPSAMGQSSERHGSSVCVNGTKQRKSQKVINNGQTLTTILQSGEATEAAEATRTARVARVAGAATTDFVFRKATPTTATATTPATAPALVPAPAPATATATQKSDYHPLCFIKMPLRQLIPTLLTAVIFVSELSRCDTQLLDQLITAQKRPPNINQTERIDLSSSLPRTEEMSKPNPVRSNLKPSLINHHLNRTQEKLSFSSASPSPSSTATATATVTSRMSSFLPVLRLSLSLLATGGSIGKSDENLMPADIGSPTSTSTTISASLNASKLEANLEAAALIEEPHFTTNIFEDDNLMELAATARTRTALAAALSSPSSPVSSSVSFNSTNLTIPSVSYNDHDNGNGNDYSGEWFDFLPTNSVNTINNADSDLPPFNAEQQAAADLLTKGFSIPTFLPPFPVFAVADLPAYLNSMLTTTTTTTTNPKGITTPSQTISSQLLPPNSLLPSSNEDSLSEQYDSHGKLILSNPSILRGKVYGPATNITVQMGTHAYMPCHIKRLQNKPVSWVRVRDGHIISVDQTTFIADQRFQAIYQDDNDFTWLLQIKYVQPNDEGWYECQVSVEPKMSAKVYLKVVVPLTELIGDQSRFVKAGSKVALHCIVRGTLEPPQYIIWFRDKAQISDDNSHGWYTQLDRNIFGNNNSDNQNTIGSLIIPFVRKRDSGNYTCQPSNSAAVSVDLHVLSGEYSASAIMSAGTSCWLTLNHFMLYHIIMVVILLWMTRYGT